MNFYLLNIFHEHCPLCFWACNNTLFGNGRDGIKVRYRWLAGLPALPPFCFPIILHLFFTSGLDCSSLLVSFWGSGEGLLHFLGFTLDLIFLFFSFGMTVTFLVFRFIVTFGFLLYFEFFSFTFTFDFTFLYFSRFR